MSVFSDFGPFIWKLWKNVASYDRTVPSNLNDDCWKDGKCWNKSSLKAIFLNPELFVRCIRGKCIIDEIAMKRLLYDFCYS